MIPTFKLAKGTYSDQFYWVLVQDLADGEVVALRLIDEHYQRIKADLGDPRMEGWDPRIVRAIAKLFGIKRYHLEPFGED